MNPDDSLGGYFDKHSRAPAFEGSDGAAYSVDIYIEEDIDAPQTYAAALIFVKWSPDGAQPVGHLETHHLAYDDRRSEARKKLHALSLHDVKDHLEQLIEKRKELPDW